MSQTPNAASLLGGVFLAPARDAAVEVRRSLAGQLDPMLWRTVEIPGRGIVALNTNAAACPLPDPQCGFAACRENTSSGLAARIASAYRTHGPRFPAAFDETFSAIVYDRAADRVVLACDTFASGGMWYFYDREILYFGDHCAALMGAFGQPRFPCPRSIDSYFVLGQVLPPDTGYRGIHRLPLNSALIVEGTRATVQQATWKPRPSQPDSSAAAVELIHSALEEECARIGPPDSRIGLLFSGGLDSTLLAALLRKRYPRLKAHLLSDGSGDPAARAGAGALGIPLECITLDDPAELHPVHAVTRTGMPVFSFAESYISRFLAHVEPDADQFVIGCGADTVFLSTEQMANAVSVMEKVAPGRRASYQKSLDLPRVLKGHKRAVRGLLYTPEFRRSLEGAAPLTLLIRMFLDFADDGDAAALMMQYLTMNHSRNVALYAQNLHPPKTVDWPYLAKSFLNAVLGVAQYEGRPCDPGKTILRSIVARYIDTPADGYPKRGFGELLSLSEWFTPERVASSRVEVLESGICQAGILREEMVKSIYDVCSTPDRPPPLLNLAWSILSLAVWYERSFTLPSRNAMPSL